jgi:acyl carrier protein
MSADLMPETLRARIADILRDHLHVECLSADTDLIEAGILDSLAFVTLLFHLEQDFGRRIPVETLDVRDFSSVARIADFMTSANGAS